VGMDLQKAKKFFSLRGKTANLGLCRQKINNHTYSDLTYDVIYRPQRDGDNQNSYGCDARLNTNWKRMPGSQHDDVAGLKKVLLTAKEGEPQGFASINWDIAIVRDEAKCNIEWGRNEKKRKFRRRFDIESIVRLG